MTGADADLPDDFAVQLGRIAFNSGRVELYLGRLLPEVDGLLDRGLSGGRLLEALRKLPQDDLLEQVIVGYEQQQEWRNILLHGSHSYANETLWTWHVPIVGKGEVARSYQFGIGNLTRLAESWANLAEAAHLLLHRSDSHGSDG